MSKSNHKEYILNGNVKCGLISPSNYPTTKIETLEFTRYEYTPESVDVISKLIVENLNPSLLSGKFQKKYPSNHKRWKRHLFGYCVPATFSLLYFLNTENLHPFNGQDEEGENHWWLEDIKTNERFDLTSTQYNQKELEYVYSTGKPKRLYSFKGRPQKRFLDLMCLVQPSAKRHINGIDSKILFD